MNSNAKSGTAKRYAAAREYLSHCKKTGFAPTKRYYFWRSVINHASVNLEQRIHSRLQSVGQRYFARTLNQNAYARAYFTLWGLALKEFRVGPRQFFTWRQPVVSLLRTVKYSFGGLLRVLAGRNVKTSYAFKGEDLVLLALLNPVVVREGFYVDVGCHEPRFISNTFLLYRRGWRGICVDASAKLIGRHRTIRPRDQAVQALVSDGEKEMDFVEFLNGGLSSADGGHIGRNLAAGMQETWRGKMTSRTLTNILDQCQAPFAFDLLSVDAEGFDLAVLRSLDFGKYRPRVIVVEADDFDPGQPRIHPIYAFLTAKGYQFKGSLLTNLYFMEE